MATISNISINFRMLLCVSISLLIFAVAMAYPVTDMVRHGYAYGVDSANTSAVNMIGNQLEDEFSGLQQTLAADGTGGTMTWTDMPDDLADDALDEVRSITGQHVTVFRWVPETQEYVRDATTIEVAEGERAVGTLLARGAVYDAMTSGTPFVGEADILGETFETYYYPVEDGAGNPVAIFFSGYPMAALVADARSALITSLIIALALFAAMSAGAYFFVMWLLRPLDSTTRSIVALSDGQIEEDIPFTERKDEIGKISNALVILQKSMQEAVELKTVEAAHSEEAAAKQRDLSIVVEAMTEGLARLGNLDLSRQIESSADAPFPADYEGLRTSFNMLVDNLSDSVAAINEVAEEVTRDAREMASSSLDLSGRTESQAATLEQSAAALEELSESVQSTAANAGDAESITTKNRTVAKQTGEIVENAISAMTEIEASSQKITQIISVIDDIAFQTNLLALNAGVEAARAGEAGRGFAVVASEVRALAQHSSSSAQEIKSLIASSSEQVENGSKLVRKAGDSIGDIIDRVDRVAGLVSDIAISAKEQSIGVTEINSGVRDLDAATQRNAAMAEEASAASEGLTTAADRLADQLARFQVTGSSAAPNWAAAAASVPDDDPQDEGAAFAPPMAVNAPAMSQDAFDPQAQDDVFREF